MNHLDNDWSESSFLERWQTVLLLVFVLFAMVTCAAFFLGTDGILKIFGLVDDTFHGTISIETSPSEAVIEVDFQSYSNSETREIDWAQGTDHIVEVRHPAFLSEKMIIHVPGDSSPLVSNSTDNMKFKIVENAITITANLVSEYLSGKIKSSPKGASITVNKVDTRQKSPMNFEFRVGDVYTITAEKKGYEPRTVEFKIDDFDSDSTVTLKLKKKPKPDIPQGRLVLSSDYPVNVYRGSKLLIRNKKAATVFLKPGTYSIRTKNKKYLLDETQSIKIRDKKTSKISLDPAGSIIIETKPAGAEIYVDETFLGNAPETFQLAPGLYNIVFKWDNCEGTENRWIKVVSGQTRKIPLVRGCQ